MGLISNISNRLRPSNVSEHAQIRMMTEHGNGFYAFDGKLYKSDIVRACIRPKAKAIGKLVAKHIREYDDENGHHIDTNKQVYMRLLLEEPNEYMSGQVMQEKIATQLMLNSNAFILIMRDQFNVPCKMYPIPAGSVEALFDKSGKLYLRFTYDNGKTDTFPYTEIIHLRNDFYENEIFGDSPAQALSDVMTVVKTIDQGIVKAIKNGAVIRWLLKIVGTSRPDDVEKQVEKFASQFLNVTNGSGVAGVDAKVDAQQIEPKDYVPNALQMDKSIERIYRFFNTNANIVSSSFTEDEWISYYEAQIEPDVVQMANEYTRKVFSRRERGFGNRIMFEASNLEYASMQTKLNLVQYVDRGIMTPNEVRSYLNLAPIEGGDVALLRKDTGTLLESGEE